MFPGFARRQCVAAPSRPSDVPSYIVLLCARTVVAVSSCLYAFVVGTRRVDVHRALKNRLPRRVTVPCDVLEMDARATALCTTDALCQAAHSSASEIDDGAPALPFPSGSPPVSEPPWNLARVDRSALRRRQGAHDGSPDALEPHETV